MATNFVDKNISSIELNGTKYNIKTVSFHATEAEWNAGNLSSYVPKQGEIIIYDKDEVYSYERFKIGDGVNSVSNLPFIGGQNDIEAITIDEINTICGTVILDSSEVAL